MENKEMIINGVDVSGCECLTKTVHCKAQMSIMGTDTNKCECFPNCHYKQLKRKEQECEKLKTQILSLQTMEIEELEKLKQEKAEIKKYLGISSKTIMQRLEELQEFKDELKISEYRYKQALDDIEEITSGTYYETEQTVKFKMQDIMDIINKAKNGE